MPMLMYPALFAAMVEIGCIIFLMRFAKQHHARWLTGACAFLMSLGAACSVGAAGEVIFFSISGLADELDLIIACGWSIIAFIGIIFAARFAPSRWLVVTPCCVVGAIFAAFGLVLI